jgi:hypothetical protein
VIFYHAGAKPASKAHPWDNPTIPAAPWKINVMITYFEFQEKKQGKKKRVFLKSLAKGRKKKKKICMYCHKKCGGRCDRRLEKGNCPVCGVFWEECECSE